MTEDLDISKRNTYYPLQVQLTSYPYVLSHVVGITGAGLAGKEPVNQDIMKYMDRPKNGS